MYVYFSIPEATYLAFRRKYGKTSSQPPVQLNLVLADGQPFPNRGHIDFADRLVDAQTGTLSVRAIFPNPGGLLLPGQFARVRFMMAERSNALLLPKEALVENLNTKGRAGGRSGQQSFLENDHHRWPIRRQLHRRFWIER